MDHDCEERLGHELAALVDSKLHILAQPEHPF
jgi:hypothetical protein